MKLVHHESNIAVQSCAAASKVLDSVAEEAAVSVANEVCLGIDCFLNLV